MNLPVKQRLGLIEFLSRHEKVLLIGTQNLVCYFVHQIPFDSSENQKSQAAYDEERENWSDDRRDAGAV
jgi:hypothetical protein